MVRLKPGIGYVVMPASVAAVLHQSGVLRSLRHRQQSNPFPDLDEFLDDVEFVAEQAIAAVASASKTRAQLLSPASSVSVSHAAAASGCSESAIRQAIDSGRLAASKDDNGRWVIPLDALDAWQAQRRPKRRRTIRMVTFTPDTVVQRLVDAGQSSAATVTPVSVGLSIAAGSLALLDEALRSITPAHRTHALAGLAILRENPHALPGAGSEAPE